jgi:hypothetical protein
MLKAVSDDDDNCGERRNVENPEIVLWLKFHLIK